MKFRILLLFCSLAILSCNVENPNATSASETSSSDTSPFAINLNNNNSLTYEGIRIFPITADVDHISAHEELASFKNLKESIGQIKGFEIMEKKEFGRDGGRGDVNELTVYNKSKDTIIIISGDVITGGKQDRVIEQNYAIVPGTIQNIPVFCVEQNRWYVKDDADLTPKEKAKKNKNIYAFHGYVNVASNEVRHNVKYSDQNAVWAAVGSVTKKNKAESSTNTYAALEKSKEFTAKRDEFINHFKDIFQGSEDVVGMVVTNGNKVLGTEIFNHPTLFKKQFEVMLHGYTTDAISNENKNEINLNKVKSHFEKVQREYGKELGDKESVKKFKYNGKIVHFSSL